MRPFTIINEEESSSCYLLFDGNVYYYLESVDRDNQTCHLWQHSECNSNIIETNGSLCDDNKGQIVHTQHKMDTMHPNDVVIEINEDEDVPHTINEHGRSGKATSESRKLLHPNTTNSTKTVIGGLSSFMFPCNRKKSDTQRNYENKKYLWKRIRIMVRNYKFHWFMALALNAVWVVGTMGIHGKVRDHQRQTLRDGGSLILNRVYEVNGKRVTLKVSPTGVLTTSKTRCWLGQLCSSVDEKEFQILFSDLPEIESTSKADFSELSITVIDKADSEKKMMEIHGERAGLERIFGLNGYLVQRHRYLVQRQQRDSEPVLAEINDGTGYNLRFIDLIASGNQGRVLKVFDEKSQKHYALKIFEHKLDYEQEVEIMNKIKSIDDQRIHVPIIHCEAPNNLAFLMDIIEGEDLRDVQPFNDDDMETALQELEQTIEILAEIGISHNDINGRNVRKGSDGKWWIIDFGSGIFIDLSKHDKQILVQLDEYMKRYYIDNIIGNIPYLSPAIYWLNERLSNLDENDDKEIEIRGVFIFANSWSLQALLAHKMNKWDIPDEIDAVIKAIHELCTPTIDRELGKYDFTRVITKDKYKLVWEHWRRQGEVHPKLKRQAVRESDPWIYK